MALRQRTWGILVRPYYQDGEMVVHYSGVPKAGIKSDLGSTNASYDTAKALKGNLEGMEEWNTVPADKGGWTMWYATTSYEKIKEKYKECLETHPKGHTRIVEIMPVDTMITPIS